MLNSVLVDGIVDDVRIAGRYTEIILADGKGGLFPVYTREKIDKDWISKKLRVCGLLQVVKCLWRGLESRKVVVLADFLKEL